MESSQNSPIRVRIQDVEYSLVGVEDAETMQEVADLVNWHLRQLATLQSDLTPYKMVLLTALNLADELLRLQKQLKQNQQEAAEFEQQVADRAARLTQMCTRLQT